VSNFRHGDSISQTKGYLSSLHGMIYRNLYYIVDWKFHTDVLIRLKVGLGGILMIKATKYKNVDQINSEDDIHGTLLAKNINGVTHDHYITFYLDMDIDGANNSFVQIKMAKQTVKNGQTPRFFFRK